MQTFTSLPLLLASLALVACGNSSHANSSTDKNASPVVSAASELDGVWSTGCMSGEKDSASQEVRFQGYRMWTKASSFSDTNCKTPVQVDENAGSFRVGIQISEQARVRAFDYGLSHSAITPFTEDGVKVAAATRSDLRFSVGVRTELLTPRQVEDASQDEGGGTYSAMEIDGNRFYFAAGADETWHEETRPKQVDRRVVFIKQ